MKKILITGALLLREVARFFYISGCIYFALRTPFRKRLVSHLRTGSS